MNESTHNPGSLNQYTYVEGNPINSNDPDGTLKCTDAPDLINGETFGSEILASNDRGLLGRVIWAESDNGADNGFQTQDYFDEKAAVAVSIVNRLDILNYRMLIRDGNGGYMNPRFLGWGPVDASLTQVLSQPDQYASVSGGDINSAFKRKLNSVFAGDAKSEDCIAAINSFQGAIAALGHVLADPFGTKGLTTSFHHGTSTGTA